MAGKNDKRQRIWVCNPYHSQWTSRQAENGLNECRHVFMTAALISSFYERVAQTRHRLRMRSRYLNWPMCAALKNDALGQTHVGFEHQRHTRQRRLSLMMHADSVVKSVNIPLGHSMAGGRFAKTEFTGRINFGRLSSHFARVARCGENWLLEYWGMKTASLY
jgi:hypothetical protein